MTLLAVPTSMPLQSSSDKGSISGLPLNISSCTSPPSHCNSNLQCLDGTGGLFTIDMGS